MARKPQKAPSGPFSRPFVSNRLRWATVAVVVVGLIWIGWRWLSPPPVSALGGGVVLSARSPNEPSVFVPSQRGTVPDGKLSLSSADDPRGEAGVLAYGELRRLFDYYLSALGEQDLPAITLQIQTQLDQRLNAVDAKRARRLLDSYLYFKRALVDLEIKPGLAGDTVGAIRQRMLAQQALRDKFFTAVEVEGMFGFEDAYDADAVARLTISQNPQLTAKDKQSQLAALDAAMSPVLRNEREANVVVVRMEQRIAEMRAQGASDDEVYRARAQAFDAGAAGRLADLDREEADWKRRIANYLDARIKLLKTHVNSSTVERQQALLALQQSSFTEDERRRLVAYEPTD